MTRVDTSELYREIRDLERHNKVLQKADKYREKIWKKRVAELEHELTQVRTASRQHKERKEFLEAHCDRLDDQIDRLKASLQEKKDD